MRQVLLGRILLLIISLFVSVHAADPTAAFEAANRLYEQEHFAEAAQAYQKMIDSGQVSAAVLFNCGNALFKSGQTGRAIIQYRRAAALDPRDPDLLANLQFARASVPGGGTGAREQWRRWLGRLSLNEWTTTTAVLFWTWMLLLAATAWQPACRKSLRPFILASGLATFLSAGGLARVAWDHFGTEPAVVIVPEAIVRYGPLEDSKISFPARDGVELLVTDRERDWVRIEDHSRRTGWIRMDQVAAVHK